MANEELIYRITRAIYERLGRPRTRARSSNWSPTSIDQSSRRWLKMDLRPLLFQALRSTSFGEATAPEGSADRLVISVFGMDHPGIVAGVSQILAEAGCSIVDINQTVVQGKFAMVIIANISGSKLSVTELKERFRSEGEKLGVHIYAQREDLFNAMHRI